MSEPALRSVDDYTEAELKAWAEAHLPVGMPQAAAVLRLLDEVGLSRRLNLSLADRVYLQSELLSKRAERTTTEG